MNTIMRSIGGAIGGQLSASILASSVAASGLPTDERASPLAFLVSAVGLLLAVGAAVLIPRAGTASAAVAVSTVADTA